MKKLLLTLLCCLGIIIQAQELKCTVTVYNAVPSQCNGNHLRTADGSIIDTQKLERGELKWCAVSRDLLKTGYKYGDKIEVISTDPTIAGIYEIHDTTSPKLTRRVDILMPRKINKGKWTGVKIKRIP